MKRKHHDETDQSHQNGDNVTNQAEHVYLPAKKKKKMKDQDQRQTKYNLKRLQMRERKEARLTKKIRRQMVALEKRKDDKQTRDELLQELFQLQLNPSESAQLSSVTQIKRKGTGKKSLKEKLLDSAPIIVDGEPKELNVLKKKIKFAETIHNRVQQEDYYSTDSEDSVENEDDEEDEDQNVSLNGTNNKNEQVKIEIPEEPTRTSETPESPVKTKTVVNDSRKETSTDATKKKNETSKESMSSLQLKSVVITSRDPLVEAQRRKLPIYSEEQSIVEAINENMVTILNGETGSGKTTQVPQFLYEAGYTDRGLIGITEPRRVAAIAMAKRVGVELGLPKVSSYQIRYEGDRNDDTRILFMTDGVLLKEMQTDVMLKKYSVIIIDEAHERSMYSDVLIGMLSRIVALRETTNPLKLILMSATLLESDFKHKRLFPSLTPKVLTVESRQFPVSLHFEKRTPQDFLVAAFKKICRVHEELPAGAMLVFVPSQADVHTLIQHLMSRYPGDAKSSQRKEDHQFEKFSNRGRKVNPHDFDQEDLMEEEITEDGDEDDQNENNQDNFAIGPPKSRQRLYCLPLYSLLSSEKQKRVFEEPPEGSRLCVVSTNIAETSITIPGVRYVIDTGFEKRRCYDPVTGVSQFVVARCSQASAEQRSGRAGRVCAGHAYRLFSSQVFSDMEKFSRPEILDKPPDQLVLLLKSMNIVKVVNFPFPTTPEADALESAENRLIKLGALSLTTQNNKTEARITPLGHSLSTFPLSPSYAKVITMANQHSLMPYAIALISILSAREPLINMASLRNLDESDSKQRIIELLKLRRQWLGKGTTRRLGDLAVLLSAILESEKCKMRNEECDKLGLRPKAMTEVRKVRIQLSKIVNQTFSVVSPFEPQLPIIGDNQANLLRQMLVACIPEKIARRVPLSSGVDDVPKGAYQSQLLEDYVFIDPTSTLFTEEPDYVLFQEIVQLNDKFCMQSVMVVDESWIYRLAEERCQFGEIEKDTEIKYDEAQDALVSLVSVYFGPRRWELAKVERPLPHNLQTYRHFAEFLLAGKICNSWLEYSGKLLAPPTTMTREWARLQPRTEQFLNALVKKEVLSRSALTLHLKKDPSYLLEEYLAWLPASLHAKVRLAWPIV